MKKLRMVKSNSITLEEGCNKYLDNCRARNLREGTINHYRQIYVQFGKFFDITTSKPFDGEDDNIIDWQSGNRENPSMLLGFFSVCGLFYSTCF